MKADTHISNVISCILRAWETQTEPIGAAAEKLAVTIVNKRNFFVFGCSRAGILAEEVFYRIGGLAAINPIFFSGFMLNTPGYHHFSAGVPAGPGKNPADPEPRLGR